MGRGIFLWPHPPGYRAAEPSNVGELRGADPSIGPIDRIASAPGGRVEDRLGEARIVLEAGPDDQQVRVIETPKEARTVHTFWFAWVAFHPETTVYAEE